MSVEEATFLLAVQRIVGRVQIQDDLLGCASFLRGGGVRIEEQVNEQSFDGGRLVTDLVIAGRRRLGEFEPIEGRLAGHRRATGAAGLELAGQDRHHRIVAQLVVVDEVFIAERKTEDPLANERRHGVLDEFLPACITKAGGEPLDETNGPIGGAEQQRAGLAGDVTTVEIGDDAAALHGCKHIAACATLCRHRGASPSRLKSFFAKQLSLIRSPDAPLSVRYSG